MIFFPFFSFSSLAFTLIAVVVASLFFFSAVRVGPDYVQRIAHHEPPGDIAHTLEPRPERIAESTEIN